MIPCIGELNFAAPEDVIVDNAKLLCMDALPSMEPTMRPAELPAVMLLLIAVQLVNRILT